MKKLIIISFLFIANLCIAETIEERALMITKNCKTDLERVDSLSKWLTYNIKSELVVDGKKLSGIEISNYLVSKFPRRMNVYGCLFDEDKLIIQRTSFCFKNRIGVCEDFSVMMHLMCKKLNIKSYIVYCRKKGYHAINSIILNNKSILVDVAWYSDDRKYFNMSKDFYNSHYTPLEGFGFVENNNYLQFNKFEYYDIKLVNLYLNNEVYVSSIYNDINTILNIKPIKKEIKNQTASPSPTPIQIILIDTTKFEKIMKIYNGIDFRDDYVKLTKFGKNRVKKCDRENYKNIKIEKYKKEVNSYYSNWVLYNEQMYSITKSDIYKVNIDKLNTEKHRIENMLKLYIIANY